jgi:hypothetical protein
MATYVPNAVQTTEPTSDKTVESAALEFRTLKTDTVRMLRFPAADAALNRGELPVAATRAGKLLAFDGNGAPVAGASSAAVDNLLVIGADIIAGAATILQAVTDAQSASATAIASAATATAQASTATSAAAAADADALAADADAAAAANSASLALAYKNSANDSRLLASNSALSASTSATTATAQATIALNAKSAAELAADQAAISASSASLIIVSGLGFTASTAYDFGYVADPMDLFPTDYGTL